MIVQEQFSPIPMTADQTLTRADGRGLGGFLAKTSGTLTVTSNGTTIIDAVPVTAGVYTPMPFSGFNGFVVTLAGGASGTLGV